MADPTRSKSKGRGQTSASDGKGEIGSDNQLIFWTTPAHGRSCQVDLTEFATGKSVPAEKRGQWGGDFRGRPQLIEELAPAIRILYSTANEKVVGLLIGSLRNFWRHLDGIGGIFPCECVDNIDEAIAALWVHNGAVRTDYVNVRKIIYTCRQTRGLSPQAWPSLPEREMKQSDTPSHSACKALYHTLKIWVQKLVTFWAEGDRLAAQGKDPRRGPTSVNGSLLPDAYANPADRAALFKLLMTECGTPLPCQRYIPVVVRKFGSDAPLVPGAPPESCRGIGGQLRWFYPSFEDACIFLLLFLLLTGWNAQVAFDLDVSSDKWWEPHPLRNDLVLIHSVKHRAGGAIQTAISMVKPGFHPYQLLRKFIEQTKPLRNELQRRLVVAEITLANNPADPEQKRIVELLREGVRSPWLYFRRDSLGEIEWLSAGRSPKINRVFSAIIEQANDLIKLRHANAKAAGKAEGRPELIGQMVVSDLRDAWIGYAYAHSGYSWLIAKLAAGHNSINALRDYLRQRRWRSYGEQQYRKFMDALWAEIGERRIVDGAILRWMVTNGEISEEQRRRWEAHKDRTRMGVGCRDFNHPPQEIAPDHVEGSGCRVQRCTLCRHAIVFQDSLDGLARRLAELEHIQSTIPLPAWLESSFPDEVEATESTLTLFKEEDAHAAVEKWRREIASGKHYVFQFEGSYKEST